MPSQAFVTEPRVARQRRELTDARSADLLPTGELARLVSLGSAKGATLPVCVAKVNGELHAIADVCPHRGASLSRGTLDGYLITCPLHALRFDVRTGKVDGTSHLKATAFDLEILDDELVVRHRGPVRWLKSLLPGSRRRNETCR